LTFSDDLPESNQKTEVLLNDRCYCPQHLFRIATCRRPGAVEPPYRGRRTCRAGGLREAANALGYRTTAAESAEHALRVIDAHYIDVVLLDLRLPGVGGLEVLRQLKKPRPDIEIVVVTGHGTVESAVQAMKAGAYDYMTKPFSLEELRLLLARGASHLKLKTENRVLREKIRSR
jgi:DNA-binding NtrC family response regulator